MADASSIAIRRSRAADAEAMLAIRQNPVTRRHQPLEPGTLVRTWTEILRNPAFLAYSALTMASYAGLFTFLATSPFVFLEVLGLSRVQYGMMMFGVTLVYIVGTVVCRRLLPRLGLQRTVAIAGAVSLAAGSTMGLLALAGVSSPWAIIVPHALFMLGHGVHQPCGQSAAVAPFPHAAGAASALNGFIMMLAAFAVGGIAWLLGRRVLAGEIEQLEELRPALLEFALTPYLGTAEAHVEEERTGGHDGSPPRTRSAWNNGSVARKLTSTTTISPSVSTATSDVASLSRSTRSPWKATLSDPSR